MMRTLILFIFTIFIGTHSFGQVTYSDVAQTFIDNCASCHRPGGGAPFSVLTYNEISPWATAIEHEVQEGFMPPWAADTSYMHFANERAMNLADRNAILQWIADGATEGDPGQLPTPPNYPATLLNGTPDLILNMQTIQSNANTEDAYNTVVIPTGLATARYIRALEIVPVNAELTHHVIVNADTAGQVVNDLSGTSFNIEGDIAIGSYQPGANPIVFPNSSELKLGIQIPANGDLVLQIHTPNYTSTGPSLGMNIDLEVRIFLYPPGEPGIRPVYSESPLQYWGNDFYILPEEIDTFYASFNPSQIAPFDLSIYSALPHSHQICTDIWNYAYNAGDTIPLIKIDRWDFEHQEYYIYKNLVRLPVGYTLKAEHIYDNTSQNHHNPFDPPQIISVGLNSTDEMLFDGFQFIVYLPGDEDINVDSLVNNDPLLNYLSVHDIEEQLVNSYVVPNPTSDNAKIYFVHKHSDWSKYSLKVWDMKGREVELSAKFNNGYAEISGLNEEQGIYFYEIYSEEEKISVGKFVID